MELSDTRRKRAFFFLLPVRIIIDLGWMVGWCLAAGALVVIFIVEPTQNRKKIDEQLFGRVKAELWRQESSNGPFLRAKLYAIYTDEEGEWHDSTWFNTGTKDPAKKTDVENLGRAAMWVEKVTRERAIGEDEAREAA